MLLPPGAEPFSGRGLIKGGEKGIHIRILQNPRIDRKRGYILQEEIGFPILLTVDHFLTGHAELISHLCLRQTHDFTNVSNIH